MIDILHQRISAPGGHFGLHLVQANAKNGYAMNAAFLFGSGISYEAGGPTVGRVTEEVLNAIMERHTDLRFQPRREEEDESSPLVRKIQGLLKTIQSLFSDYYRDRHQRPINYEDLYFICDQLAQEGLGELPDPMVYEVHRSLLRSVPGEWSTPDPHPGIDWFTQLCEDATEFIQWVVHLQLARLKDPIGLEALGPVVRNLKTTSIFTLNHDVLIEALLGKEGISFADGFDDVDGDFRRFDPGYLFKANDVTLLKLHGSIDWYLYPFTSKDGSRFQQYAKPGKKTSIWHGRDAQGEMLLPQDVKPTFLTGTTSKELSYGSGIFPDVFEAFRRQLHEHNVLVVSGYGWGDKGINRRVNAWMMSSLSRRMIILHEGGEDAIRRIPFWFFRFDDDRYAGRVTVVSKWLKDIEPDELIELIAAANGGKGQQT